MNRKRHLRMAAAGMLLVVAFAAHAAARGADAVLPAQTTHAAAPSPMLCNRNTAFCGQVLRIDSASGTIPSVAAGAHYGPEWGIPPTSNDSTGTGWCVDDTHTGYPAGPITEQPLPAIWTQRQMRIAGAIIALYGGDRVLPYQDLEVDQHGELADAGTRVVNATRHRHIGIWLTLRSVLPDPAGTPRIDLGTARTFLDIAGRRASVSGNAAVPLARQMVRNAEAMAPVGDISVTARFVDGSPPTLHGEEESVVVRVTDGDGRPLPSYPVWLRRTLNATVAPGDTSDRVDPTALANVERVGWPTFDTTNRVTNAMLTDADGEATFRIRVDEPTDWGIEFATEGPPLRLRIFGDDIRAQNNVTLADDAPPRARAELGGDLSLRTIRVVKRSSDSRFGVAGGVFALIDGNGAEVDRGTSGTNGRVDFEPFSEIAHPPPHVIREITAPPGLQHIRDDIAVPAAVPPANDTDPWIPGDVDAPTVVEIHNDPVLHDLVIEKTITGVAGANDDLSGFTFTVTRADADSMEATVVTDSSGRTPSLAVAAGEYVVTETGRPGWWPANQPLPSSISATVDIDDLATVTFSFANDLPAPTIVTSATDEADGDKYLARSGGTIVDDVRLCGLVPDTKYTINGRLLFVTDDGTVEATDIVATTDIVGSAGCVATSLSFEIPNSSAHLTARGHFVVTEELLVDDVVVARHDDPDSTDQTIHLEDLETPPTLPLPPDTTLPETTTTTTAPTTTTTHATTTTVPATTTTTTAPTTTTPTTTSTTTSTTAPPSTTPPSTTPPSTSPPSTSPPSTEPPATAPPGEPDLPRTGDEAWRTWYRVGSLILLLGAALFFASTLGLGTLGIDTPGDTRTRSRRASARFPGTYATRTTRDEP